MATTYKFKADRLDELQPKLDKLNKRAAKLDLPPIGYTLIATTLEPDIDARGNRTGRMVQFCEVELTGAVPRVAGWEFVARLEHSDAGNIVSHAPGCEADIPDQYRTAKPDCDHCKKDRRRFDTFVLREVATTQFKQVGRSCLADFLRTEDIGAAIGIWKLMQELLDWAQLDSEESEGGGFSSGPCFYETTRFLEFTFCVVRQEGWMSKAQARERFEPVESTSDAVEFLMNRPKRPEDEKAATRERRERLTPTEADKEKARLAIDWAGNLRGSSDYEHNIMTIARSEAFKPRNAGLAASIAVAFQRHNEEELNRKRLASAGVSEHFGEVGKRYDLSLEVTAIKSLESMYGTTTLVMLADSEGRRFKWFASGVKDFSAGEFVTGKCTIKGHGDYKGNLETVLTRCSFKVIEKAA